MAFTADELWKVIQEKTGGDLELAGRVMEEVVALDTIFNGDVEAVKGMLKLLSGIGARAKLEVQRDALYREMQTKQQELTALQQSLQQQSVAASQETTVLVQQLQAQAAQLQAQIDAINASLPELLSVK